VEALRSRHDDELHYREQCWRCDSAKALNAANVAAVVAIAKYGQLADAHSYLGHHTSPPLASPIIALSTRASSILRLLSPRTIRAMRIR
jgi:hypothetical protein